MSAIRRERRIGADTLFMRRWKSEHGSRILRTWNLNGCVFSQNGSKIGPFHDSAALARLKHARKYAMNLGEVGRIAVGVNVKLMSNLVVTRLDEYPVQEVLRYNGLDAWACRRVYDKYHDQVDQEAYQRLLATVNTLHRHGINGPSYRPGSR